MKIVVLYFLKLINTIFSENIGASFYSCNSSIINSILTFQYQNNSAQNCFNELRYLDESKGVKFVKTLLKANCETVKVVNTPNHYPNINLKEGNKIVYKPL